MSLARSAAVLALMLLPHVLLPRSVLADDVLTGTKTVRVTSDTVTVEDFRREKFPDFAAESLRRFFGLGRNSPLIARATAQNAIYDIEILAPSKCLARSLSRSGWQRLRFEFSYGIDDVYLAQTSKVRFEIQLRLVSGETADFRQDSQPPTERFRQVPTPELTDLAYRIAGFVNSEMRRSCFEKVSLTFCPAARVEQCL